MKIKVSISNLRLREKPSLIGKVLGKVDVGTHEVLQKVKSAGKTWYQIKKGWCAKVEGVKEIQDEEWIAPQPTEADKKKDQIYVGKFNLNIRKDSDIKSDKMGVCKQDSFYDVLDLEESTDYTWYQLGEDAWVAGVSGVEYYPAGTPRISKELRERIAVTKNNLSKADKAIQLKKCSENYEELNVKLIQLNNWMDGKFDYIDFDYEDDNEYNEIDLIYTTDIHGYWKGYCESQRVQTNFSMADLTTYQKKLKSQGIPSLIVNCGDIIHGSASANANKGNDAIKAFNDVDMFASVFGNHEFRYDHEQPGVFGEQVPKIESMTACNFIYKKTGELVFKPYRLARFGSKTIGIIGIGFPGTDGVDMQEYEALTDERCYAQVQKYINELKDLGINYIMALVHLGKATDERAGGKISMPSIVENTSGLDMILPGHTHAITETDYVTDKSGKQVMVAAQPRCDLMYITRIRLKKDGMTSETLTNI